MQMPLVLFAVICLIGAELGHLIVVPIGGVVLPAFSPVIGVLLGTLVLSERRRWRMLVPTACGAMLLSSVAVHGRPVLPAIALIVIAGLEATAAAWLVHRATDGPFALNRVSHAWALVVASVLLPIAGGALVSCVLLFDGLSSSFFAGWRAWWLADSLGMLVAAPLTIAAIAQRAMFARVVRSWKALEIASVFIGGTVVAVGVFSEALDPLVRVPAYVLPFLLWPVFRFGPGGSSAAIFIVSLIGLWNAARGQGPLALVGVPTANLVLRSQGAMAISAVSFLLLASVVAERKRVAHEYAALVAELQQAMAEIKTLRGFIPICAWCHKVRDDAGFWQRIEMYLDAHTDATFSHGICPSCAEEAGHEIAAHRATARADAMRPAQVTEEPELPDSST
jgi:integral membrane sensor domain MASE1